MADQLKQIVKIKIDVSKIDKSRLFKGEKGTYLDATVFLSQDADQYGNNGMITQDVSKEEREAGVRGAILGNAKIMGGSKKAAPKKEAAKVEDPFVDAEAADDLPF